MITEFSLMLLAAGLAAFGCRVAGFWFMGFVPMTPRLERALRATPLAVMVGIVAPAASRGGVPELVALAATAVAMRLSGNDLLAAVVGVGAVAGLRAWMG